MIHEENQSIVMLEEEIKIDEHLAKENKVPNKTEHKILFPGI